MMFVMGVSTNQRRLDGPAAPAGRLPVDRGRTGCLPAGRTSSIGTGDPGRVLVACRAVPLLALAVVLWDAAADVLPDHPVVWVVTPVRLVVLLGLVGLLPSLATARWAAIGPRLMRLLAFLLLSLLLLVAAAVPAHTYGAWSAWRGLVTCVGVALLAAGVVGFRPQSWRAVMSASTVAVAVAALAGIRQSVQGIPTGFCRGALDGSADSCGHPGVLVRADGTFGNPNLLAAFLVLVVPLAAAYAAGEDDRDSRVVGALLAVAGVGGLVATGSRAAVMSVVVAVAAFVVLRRPTRRRVLVGVVGTLGALAAGVAALALGVGVGVRLDVWRAAVQLVGQYPWGVGLGRTGDLLAAAVPGDEQFRHAHNLWLDMLLAAGPGGLVAVAGLTLLAAVCAVRAAKRGSAAGVALGCSLAGFALYCLFDNPLNAIRNAYAAWMILGLVIGVDAAVGPGPDSSDTGTAPAEVLLPAESAEAVPPARVRSTRVGSSSYVRGPWR